MNEKLKSLFLLAKYKMRYKKKFHKIHDYKLNISEPKTWNEKIIYRMCYGNRETMAFFADKLKVRNYVKATIGDKYLIPLIATTEQMDQSFFDTLPNQFVIKTNHSAGPKYIEIVKNKLACDPNKLIKKMNKAVKTGFGYATGELFYSKIEKRIIAEEYLDGGDDGLTDYKVHCFNNKDKLTQYIQVDTGRFTEHKRSFYDSDWNLQAFTLKPKFASVANIERPILLKEMLALAENLSKPFDYVRIDFYILNGNIYFGEITQTHGGGKAKFNDKKYDEQWGELWNIDHNNHHLYTK